MHKVDVISDFPKLHFVNIKSVEWLKKKSFNDFKCM